MNIIHCFTFCSIFLMTIIHFLQLRLNDNIIYYKLKVGAILLITSDDILKTIGTKIKKARLEKKFTQEGIAENINISPDLLRNIENGRNIGSLPTLLNICNFLELSPNFLFSDLLTFKVNYLDTILIDYISKLSIEDKQILKNIIIHLDKNY